MPVAGGYLCGLLPLQASARAASAVDINRWVRAAALQGPGNRLPVATAHLRAGEYGRAQCRKAGGLPAAFTDGCTQHHSNLRDVMALAQR